MRILLILLALWPGTMVAQSCSEETREVKVAEVRLKAAKEKEEHCEKTKPKKPSPREAFTQRWTVARERQVKEIQEIQKRHSKEYEAIIKETGFDPRKK